MPDWSAEVMARFADWAKTKGNHNLTARHLALGGSFLSGRGTADNKAGEAMNTSARYCS